MPFSDDSETLLRKADALWESDVVPTLESYVRIPNLSPHFAPDWETQGHMDDAVELLLGWIESRPISGMTVEVFRPDGLTPTILIDIPGFGDGEETTDPGILFYGHLDKQPEFTGWREGLGPWDPVREGDRLYGRGVADDGYSTFCALTAIQLLRESGGSHSRCRVLIEGSEESGSPDLEPALELIGDRLGQPAIVIALDSGCPTYDRMWITDSLRGLVSGVLTVTVLTQGVHSGSASGVVPSSFRIARALVSRVEDEATGEVRLDEMRVDIPKGVEEAASKLQELLGHDAVGPFPSVDRLGLMSDSPADGVIRVTWRPSLSVIGADGFPPVATAGNVLRPFTSLALSFRVPPTCDSEKALAELKRVLEADPPYGATVSFEGVHADGWFAPPLESWVAQIADDASVSGFSNPAGTLGEGGSIPFMKMLSERFSDTSFIATGVLGPGSNAHGPNEFLDLQMAKRLTVAMSVMLEGECRHRLASR